MNKLGMLPVMAALAIATPAVAQRLQAQRYAASLQSMVGQSDARGMKIASIRGERHVLVVVLDGPRGWRGNLSDREVSALFMNGYCADGPPELFETGLTLRVDSLDDGRALRRGRVHENCD